MPDDWKHVTEDEFKAFIAAYPRPLQADLLRICDPSRMQYNDFSGGKVWPESVVADYATWGCDPNNIWSETPGEWRIRTDLTNTGPQG